MEYSLILLVIAGAGIILNLSVLNNELKSEIKRLNGKVDRILDSMGIKDETLDGINKELKELILQKKNIKAIKVYREHTGLGLKESKEYIDSLSEKIYSNDK